MSLANSNCFTTTISASSSTRVTELSRPLAALTIALRSAKGPSYPSGSVTVISQSLSIDEPGKLGTIFKI